jgi:hypothetical protein
MEVGARLKLEQAWKGRKSILSHAYDPQYLQLRKETEGGKRGQFPSVIPGRTSTQAIISALHSNREYHFHSAKYLKYDQEVPSHFYFSPCSISLHSHPSARLSQQPPP